MMVLDLSITIEQCENDVLLWQDSEDGNGRDLILLTLEGARELGEKLIALAATGDQERPSVDETAK